MGSIVQTKLVIIVVILVLKREVNLQRENQ
jgi:Transposase family tnp2